MTPEAQRVAIAEACGWTYHAESRPEMKEVAVMCWIRPGNSSWNLEQLPDYLNSLDAMNEAESRLTEREQIAFGVQLDEDDLTDDEGNVCWRPLYLLIHASASRRAEAFLKAIGKWDDDK